MLVNPIKLIKQAQKEGYAVPAFNIHNLENIKACVEAAAELKSPVMLACTPSTFEFGGIENIVAICKAMSETHNIPIALHMDHHHSIEEIKRGIDLGITSVMIDASSKSLEENIKMTKEVIAYAHKKNVCVEAELGSIPGVEDSLVVEKHDDQYTDAATVKRFCDATCVDTIAVAIGTAHGIYKVTPVLNVKRLAEIKAICETPLVLHGGSGLTKQQIQDCIKNGVAKVNIGTELKPPYANAIINFFKEHPTENDPRKFLTPAIKAIKEVAKEKILICMSNNRIK